MTNEQADKLAKALYEQGRIIGLGMYDGLKQAGAGEGNFDGAGNANPTPPPPTPSNDSEVVNESADVVKDEKAEQNLPEGELAQGHVGAEEATGSSNYGGAGNANPKVAKMQGVTKALKELKNKAVDKGKKAVQAVKDNPGVAAGSAAAGAAGTIAVSKLAEADENPFADAIQ